jgi:hypothetical protein
MRQVGEIIGKWKMRRIKHLEILWLDKERASSARWRKVGAPTGAEAPVPFSSDFTARLKPSPDTRPAESIWRD